MLRSAVVFLVCAGASVVASDQFEFSKREKSSDVVQQKSEGYSPDISRWGVVQFGAPWCGPCRQQKAILQQLQGSLGRYSYIDTDQNRQLASRSKVSSIPDTRLIYLNDAGNWIQVLDGKMRQRWVGLVSKRQILAEIQKRATASSRAVRVEQSSRAAAAARPRTDTADVPSPVRRTPWGTFDLRTWSRWCSSRRCQMCNTIDALQRQYLQAKTAAERERIAKKAWQQPSGSEERIHALALLRLAPDDVFCDIGCGDGQVLIMAVQRYGCTAVGIEIDPVLAERARQNVSEAGLSDRIRVLTTDALEWDPDDHGVTAAYVYLFPELIERLMPTLERIQRVVSVGHNLPGQRDREYHHAFLLEN